MPSQRNQSESFWFKCPAFYQGLRSKVGLAAAKVAGLRINLNVQGCSIEAFFEGAGRPSKPFWGPQQGQE
jgi:hypothetical protein